MRCQDIDPQQLWALDAAVLWPVVLCRVKSCCVCESASKTNPGSLSLGSSYDSITPCSRRLWRLSEGPVQLFFPELESMEEMFLLFLESLYPEL